MHRTPNRARGPAAPAPPGSGWAEGPHGPAPPLPDPSPRRVWGRKPRFVHPPGSILPQPARKPRPGRGPSAQRGGLARRERRRGLPHLERWSQTELHWACRAALGTGKAGSGSRSPSTAPPYGPAPACPAPAGAARVGSSRAGRAELGRGGRTAGRLHLALAVSGCCRHPLQSLCRERCGRAQRDPGVTHQLSTRCHPSGVPEEGPRCDSSPRPGFALYLSLGATRHLCLPTPGCASLRPPHAGTQPCPPCPRTFTPARKIAAELPWKPTLPSGTATLG